MTHDELLTKVELTLGTYISRYYGSKKDVELRSDVIDSLQALRAVVELHKPTENGKSCTYCYNDCHSRSGIMCEDYCRTHDAYPCFTIQAIEKELK